MNDDIPGDRNGTGISLPPGLPDEYPGYFASWESRIGAFLSTIPSPDTPGAGNDPAGAGGPGPESGDRSPLRGLPFAVKDNIAVRGVPLTCGSRILEGFVSPYDATAVRRLKAAGAFVLGKTNLDEFGMGSSTDNSAYRITDNPWEAGRVPGGSSGGSAAAVAAGLVPFALGSDTGGSVRQPASFCGVVGLKPTYGAVSRFGLVAYASSLETIGIIGDTAARVRSVFGAVRGVDPHDQTTREAPLPPAGASAAAGELPQGRRTRIGVLATAPDELDPAVARGYADARSLLGSLGYATETVELPTLDYVVPAYYTIATAEASANLARFNGIRYGPRAPGAENPDDLVERSRGTGFGSEVKLRILLGTFVLRSGFQDRFYIRAQKVRTAIRDDFAAIFRSCDALLMPVFPVPAWKRGENEPTPFQQKVADRFTCAANLAGLPALAFPVSVEDGLPVGVQLLAPEFREDLLFEAAGAFESARPVARPAGYRAFWS